MISFKESINKEILDKFGDVVLPTTISDKLVTGWLAMDYLIPIELGTSLMIYGPSMSGKSLIMMLLGASVQQKKGVFICFNTEAANRDEEFLKRVIPELSYKDILFYQPNTIEDVFDCIRTIVEKVEVESSPVLIAIDSISSCPTNHELDNDLSKVDLTAAKILSSGLRQVGNKLSKKPIVLCLLSQERDTIGAYRPVKKHTGGSAPFFYPSTVLYTKSKSSLYENSKGELLKTQSSPFQPAIGRECSLELEKTRFSAGGVVLNYIFRNDIGIDRTEGLLDLLLYKEIILQGGGWCSYKEVKFRRAEFKGFLENNPDVLKELK